MTAAVRAAAVGAALVFLGLPPATAGAQQRGHGHHRFHHRPVGSRLIVVAPFVPFGFYSAPPPPSPATPSGAIEKARPIYAWTDTNGVTTWTDRVSKVPPEHRASARREP